MPLQCFGPTLSRLTPLFAMPSWDSRRITNVAMPHCRFLRGEPGAEDWRMAEIVSGYWTGLAANGDPN